MLDDLEVLYRERLHDYTRAATAITGDEESGRDAVQEAFTKAVRKRRRFRGEGSFEAWVLRIVVNAARDARRRRLQEVEFSVATRAEELGLPLELSTDRQREVLFLHYYADLDYTTIAHVLGISLGGFGEIPPLSNCRQLQLQCQLVHLAAWMSWAQPLSKLSSHKCGPKRLNFAALSMRRQRRPPAPRQ
jgi:RNA polymerase sigma-70 factor (ECF subfamily)